MLNIDVLRKVVEATERGDAFTLVSVIDVDGSSPGKPGQKMIVYSDGRQEGTVGGGALEMRARTDALEALRRGRGAVVTYDLDPESGQGIGAACGGNAVLAIEVVEQGVRILICGGGHVAQALSRQCRELGFAYSVVDVRPEMSAADRFPGATRSILRPPHEHIAEEGLGGFTHVVIMTHNHALDRETLLAVFRAGFEGYVGMIGSGRKWQEVRGALLEEGVPEAWLGRVHCPIGFKIPGSEPARIAVAIAAEILQELPALEESRRGPGSVA